MRKLTAPAGAAAAASIEERRMALRKLQSGLGVLDFKRRGVCVCVCLFASIVRRSIITCVCISFVCGLESLKTQICMKV